MAVKQSFAVSCYPEDGPGCDVRYPASLPGLAPACNLCVRACERAAS
jgi:hypothetical protein